MQIIYVSAASRPLSRSDLDDIARRSAKNNRTSGLTGFLLSQGSLFYGVLEGSHRLVFARMEVIITDDRHRDLRILSESEIDARRFDNWSYGTLPAGEAEGGADRPVPNFIFSLARRLT